MKVLAVTNMYPSPAQPAFGVFVQDQVESLRRLGVEVDVLFMDGRRNRLNYLWAYPRLWRQLSRERYDLVHAHYVFAGLVARAQWSCPVVLTHHGPEVFLTWEAQVCRLATRWFHSVIVVSQEMRRELGIDRAYVIPCGIDMERFRPRPQTECRDALRLPRERKLVLWAGEHGRPEKRFELVRQAIDRLRAQRDGVELVLLSGRPHADVPLYMNACDALVLTSDAEGSPMVVKEAMACNVPVVATAVGDVAAVIGGTEGCFITSQEPADIAAKLKAALDYGQRTDGRRAVEHLELDAISRRIIDVYRDTLAAHGRRDVALGPAGDLPR